MRWLVVLVVALVCCCCMGCDAQIDTYELMALSDGTHIQGSFFLVSGGFNSQPEFRFYTKDAAGAIRLRGIPARYVWVHEITGDDTPHASYTVPPFADSRWDLYIPPNAIATDIRLDAE